MPLSYKNAEILLGVTVLLFDFILFHWDVPCNGNLVRGHSRNRPKGGRNSPKRCTLTHLRTAFLCFYSQRGQNPLQITLPAVFGTKLCLIHRLDWFEDTK